MSPIELLGRLHTLSKCTGQAETVLVLPGMPAQATSWVSGLSNSRAEGHVTAKDLQDFLDWIHENKNK